MEEGSRRCSILPRDVDLILQIPLTLNGGSDQIIWHYTPKGIFIVSSSYRLAVQTSMARQASGSSGKLDWLLLWHLQIPPKIKIFAWQLCHNALAMGVIYSDAVFDPLLHVVGVIIRWRMTPTYSCNVTTCMRFGKTRISFLLVCCGRHIRGSIYFVCLRICRTLII